MPDDFWTPMMAETRALTPLQKLDAIDSKPSEQARGIRRAIREGDATIGAVGGGTPTDCPHADRLEAAAGHPESVLNRWAHKLREAGE